MPLRRGAHLFLTDDCSFVNLHRFVKFASVQILASSPQHHGGIAIRKCSDVLACQDRRDDAFKALRNI